MAEKDETIEKLKKDLEKVVFFVTPTDVHVMTSLGKVCHLLQIHVVLLAVRAQMMDGNDFINDSFLKLVVGYANINIVFLLM